MTPPAATRLRRVVGDTLFRMPFDPSLGWSLERPDAGACIDLLRVGACEARSVPQSHTVTSPVGYPRYMARCLADHDIALAYQGLWAWTLEELPTSPQQLRRRRHRHRPPPDVVWIQTGAAYALRNVLGFSRRANGLRENVGRRLGPAIGPAWRLLSLWLQVAGRLPEYPGADALKRFVELIHATWPQASVGLLELPQPVLPGCIDPARLGEVVDDQRMLAEALEVDWVPRPPLGCDMALRCANGYNLSELGSAVAGRHYAGWLLRHSGGTGSPAT